MASSSEGVYVGGDSGGTRSRRPKASREGVAVGGEKKKVNDYAAGNRGSRGSYGGSDDPEPAGYVPPKRKNGKVKTPSRIKVKKRRTLYPKTRGGKHVLIPGVEPNIYYINRPSSRKKDPG